MIGVHGIAARTFAAIEGERLSVSTIFQASSESSIGFTLPESEADRAVESLRHAFRNELAAGLIDHVTTRGGMAVVAVVGDGMAGAPGVAARVFTALSTRSINVVAIAQGLSERNISFAVAGEDAAAAARSVHAAFQLSKIGGGRSQAAPRTDVVLLGFGRVGRALADQIAAPNGRPAVRVVGLLDRSGYVFDARGISRRRLLALTREKDAGALLASLGGEPAAAAEALTLMSRHAVSRPVIVDVTSDETGDLLRAAVGHGFDVVLANKKPLAGSWRSYADLLEATAAAGRRLRYEATVGAGLPIIDTFDKLVETGDRVLRIEGCVSGTLTYDRLGGVGRHAVFGRDPRGRGARLRGTGSARRSLGSGRRAQGAHPGAPARLPWPVTERGHLVPASLRKLSVPRVHVPRLRARCGVGGAHQARTAAGRVLRYVVTATPVGYRRCWGGAGRWPDRRVAGHPQPGGVHDAAVPD